MRFDDFYRVSFDPESRRYLDSPTFRGFPLGGIGNGGISLYADGDFSEARTNHSWNVPVRDLRGSFFALRTRDAKGRVEVRLLRRTHHHSREFGVENVAHTSFRGLVPHFSLEYGDQGLPVAVALRGFSPLIPHNVKDSSLPAAFFELEVENRGDGPVEVSALFSWQNVLGITGTACHAMYRRHAFRCDWSRMNYALEHGGRLPGVKFCIDKDFDPRDPRRRGIGNALIFTESSPGAEISTCLAWDQRQEVPEIWETFRREGRVGNPPGHDPALPATRVRGKCGAVCVKSVLSPGERRRIPFTLCWWMPYYVLEKDFPLKRFTGRHDGTDHGTYAANHFGSIEELAVYLARERERLREESLQLQRLLEDPARSCLPPWLADVILNSADSLITNSVLTRKGECFMIEGMGWTLAPFHCATHPFHQTWIFGALTGTLDQRLCSHLYSSVFFPGLDRSELVAFRDLAENGKVPHGNGGAEIALKDADTPYARPIPWVNNGENDWSDLNCSLILQLGKLVRMTGDLQLLRESWPRLLEMSDYLESLVVDHVPEACSTYDVFVYKPCFLYAATLYAAANRMLAALAAHIPPAVDPGASARAETFEKRADAAVRTLNEKLWNDSSGYYRVCVSRETIFQGGLAGDWFARLAGIEPVLDPARARSHAGWQDRVLVRTAAKRDQLVSGKFIGRPLPWNEATPEGKKVHLRIAGRLRADVNYIYQVVSHQAFEAIHLGLVEEGLRCLRMIYDKAYQEGYPWDMSLFGMPGFNYMTHPVMWGLFNAMTGAAVDLPGRTLYLAPRLFPGSEELRLPVFFPRFWLGVSFSATTGRGRVEILRVIDPDPGPERERNATGVAADSRGEDGGAARKNPEARVRGATGGARLEGKATLNLGNGEVCSGGDSGAGGLGCPRSRTAVGGAGRGVLGGDPGECGAGGSPPIVLDRLVLTRPDDSVKTVGLAGFRVVAGAVIEFDLA